MDIVIRGKNFEVPEPLRDAATKQLTKLDRFASGLARAEVDFVEERNKRADEHHSCEVLVHLKGHLLRAHATAAEPFGALAASVEKVEHQVKRLKEKRVARLHPRRVRTTVVEVAPPAGEELAEPVAARIVKTKQFTIKPMTAEEAALQMELLGHDFFLYTSSDTGRAALLYRRDDGDLGLIETAG